MNSRNLVPNSERTAERVKEITRKAGKASGKARAQRKQMREAFNLLLSRKEIDPENGKQKISGVEYLALKMYQKAAAGDVKAFQLIAEITGEYKQEIKVEAQAQINERILSPQEAAQFLAELEKKI